MRMTSTKFFAALLIVLGNIIRNRLGLDLGIDEQIANDLAGFLVAAVVWLVPNRPKSPKSDPDYSEAS